MVAPITNCNDRTDGRAFHFFFSKVEKETPEVEKQKKTFFFLVFEEKKRCQKTLPKRISSEQKPIQLKWSRL
jgi:hypothetical protein